MNQDIPESDFTKISIPEEVCAPQARDHNDITTTSQLCMCEDGF